MIYEGLVFLHDAAHCVQRLMRVGVCFAIALATIVALSSIGTVTADGPVGADRGSAPVDARDAKIAELQVAGIRQALCGCPLPLVYSVRRTRVLPLCKTLLLLCTSAVVEGC